MPDKNFEENTLSLDLKTPKDGKKVFLQRPKGTQDIIGEETARWAYVENLCRELFRQARFQEIRTPIFETADLFERGVGEGTDIVSKEMYTFTKSDRRLSLRPEGTAGVVRAFVEQGMSRWPKPVKLFYMGPMFRYERPQAGRQRQFHQIGVELFGPEGPAADAEVILLAWRLFERLNLPGLSLELNNIGTPESREQFKAGLRERLTPHLPELCTDCQTRFQTNPLRMLDCKNPVCQAIYAQKPIQEWLENGFNDEESEKHFTGLLRILDALKIAYRRNYSLVRGLDYYTKTVFEITTTHLGAQNAVCGGGRYDRLMSDLGGPATPAVGWALGQERLITLLGETATLRLDFYIVTDRHSAAFALADKLRTTGANVEVDLSSQGFGKQLERATRFEAIYVLVLGEDEVTNGQIQLRPASAQAERQTLTETQLVAFAQEIMKKQRGSL
jgi:histidyl-tRNA synthetase